MQEIAGLTIDPLALTALGFLVAVLGITFGLFGWVMLQSGKRPKHPAPNPAEQ